MIARIWHGVVPKEKADAYYNFLKKTGLKDYKCTKGNQGVQVLRKEGNSQTHYVLITFWDSYESIKDFAGEEIEKARYYPEDKEYLLEFEPFVKHYEVLESENQTAAS